MTRLRDVSIAAIILAAIVAASTYLVRAVVCGIRKAVK